MAVQYVAKGHNRAFRRSSSQWLICRELAAASSDCGQDMAQRSHPETTGALMGLPRHEPWLIRA